MIRGLASLLLLLGLLAMLPGGGTAHVPSEDPAGVKAESVLEAALRGAEPAGQSAEPADEPNSALLGRAPGAPGSAGALPLPLSSDALPHQTHAPFHARAPPLRDVRA